ncbi:hypothetical protein HZS_8101 [Henneguya salminicola]|nr:hypothetical protein HZS_8101 [Henneguya salminicola]
MPKIVPMDFEKALIFAANYEFPESRVIGCYFHFKKALHRKLKKYRINQAIGYIQSLTTAVDAQNQFLAYFNHTWMVRFSTSLCNISAGIRSRTNNALKHLNRRLNDLFTNAPPNICSFVEIIKDEFLYFEERSAEVCLNSYSVFKGNPTCNGAVVDRPDVVDTTEEMLSLSMSRAK